MASPSITALMPSQALPGGTSMADRVPLTGMTGVISIATPCRDSMTFTSTKGLLNGPGQNNCFLNSAVQVLWHLDIFRRSFRDLSGHACMADSCIFCALKELFSQLQFSTETALPPDVLRKALAESFFDQQRFQLGFMDDAAECFENMLLRIHQHVAHGQAEDACAAPHCIPHQKFAMTLVEQSVCGSCGASSEPLSYTQMVHYVSTSTLVYQVRSQGRLNPGETFGKLLHKAGNMGDVRSCPSSCGASIQISRSLMNHPEIVSVGLVWNSERPTLEHIMEVFSSIGTSLRLADIFNSVIDSRWAEISLHSLVGVVTYYGKHYSTFFFHTKLRVWIYFDDATVREVGPRWEQVVEKCKRGRYQPLLLLYALPDGTPVNTEHAPKQITPFFTDKTKKLPSQATLRRSVTPSPEKPVIGNTRRAITPNPETSSFNQKPPLPHGMRAYNDYQNLSVIQKNIYPTQETFDQVDGCIQKEPEYVTRKCLDFNKQHVGVHRTLSNSSSSGVEMCIPEHLNIPRRRDSGNWSGDRNSASSASSTTMENPYLYLVGKIPHGSVPGSPTRIKSDSSTSSGIYDAGYDSYSLSSNDSSSHSTLQHLMKMGHLAKIPEDYSNVNNNQTSQSCDMLCDEADELLVKSRQLEDEHDLVLALALCNAAATKARAAMNAPYNNPQTLTLARMKHNTCIMRARSLHRRMIQAQHPASKDMNPIEIRHTREGSSGSGRHSRQNSRDKGNHSRQNSRELLVTDKDKHHMPSRQNSRELLLVEKENSKPMKNIEIYATLPKKKDALKAKMNAIAFDDEEYIIYDKPPNRESRSFFSRNKNKDSQKVKEKRSRSEDRNKLSRGDFSIAPEIIGGKDTLKKAKEKEKEQEKDKDGKNKKQHKIRRKLLMGGLIKRKNRSMPDLTDAAEKEKTLPTSTLDDSTVGLKNNDNSGMSGYLSEGHLEFAGSNANPNLERSKLMRKSFHGSAGKILTVAKVPPPPPLRTTSQLSKSKLDGLEVDESGSDRPQYPLPKEIYQNHYQQDSPMSLPYYHTKNSSYEDDSYFGNSSRTVVTQAEVHQEKTLMKASPTISADSGVDEVDCLPAHTNQMLELPPYPSPPTSAIHSRQASEEFPPPPPPIDMSALDEHLPEHLRSQPEKPLDNSLLSQLQSKRLEILSPDHNKVNPVPLPPKSSGGTWLKELQAKQAALRAKKPDGSDKNGTDEINTQRYIPGEAKIASVKDLASKFETTPVNANKPQIQITEAVKTINNTNINGVLSVKRRDDEIQHTAIPPDQIAEEIREVEMLTSAVHKVFGGFKNTPQEAIEECRKQKVAKKKSVSFCDQVILVATAEEQEDDSYIPNPILERVLRSAVNKPEAQAIKNEIISLRDNEQLKNSIHPRMEQSSPISPTVEIQQPLYVRRNSLDNLLNKSEPLKCQNLQQPPQHQIYQTHSNMPQLNSNYPAQMSSSNPSYHQAQNPSQLVPTQQNCYSYATHSVQSNNILPPHSQYNNNLNMEQKGIYSTQSMGEYVPLNSYHNQNTSTQPQVRQNDPQYIRHTDIQQYKQIPQETQYKTYQTPPVNPNIYQGQCHSDPATNPHYNTHCNESTPYRQSPYQPIPQNSAIYAQYYNNRSQNSSVSRTPPDLPQIYRGQYLPQVRQTTPSPLGVPQNSIYQHSPSPAPSNISSNYNYHPSMYRGPQNNVNINQEVYQRVPPSSEYPHPHLNQNYDQYHKVAQNGTEMYQRVPPPHGEQELVSHSGKYSPYIFPPKQQPLKKSVTFEPGTKGCESPTPKAIVTPIIVNNANNSVPSDKTKCNLCRKKNVVAANLYCTDCEFYMSKFNPKS